MPKNTYTAQFKADAVNLYESNPGLGYTQAARDLGIARGTLKTWVRQARIQRGEPTKQSNGSAPALSEELTVQQHLERLEAENKALRERNKILSEERDILRKATKYFAAETNW